MKNQGTSKVSFLVGTVSAIVFLIAFLSHFGVLGFVSFGVSSIAFKVWAFTYNS